MAANIEKLVDQLSELSVMEAAELVKTLEEKWGVSAAAPVAVAAAAGPAGGAAEAAEEKSEFDVVIKDAGPKKIEVIKAIRQLTSLGLGDAKTLAETADGIVTSDLRTRRLDPGFADAIRSTSSGVCNVSMPTTSNVLYLVNTMLRLLGRAVPIESNVRRPITTV